MSDTLYLFHLQVEECFILFHSTQGGKTKAKKKKQTIKQKSFPVSSLFFPPAFSFNKTRCPFHEGFQMNTTQCLVHESICTQSICFQFAFYQRVVHCFAWENLFSICLCFMLISSLKQVTNVLYAIFPKVRKGTKISE